MDKQKRIDWLKVRISSMEQCRDEIPFGLSADESMELSAYKDSLASLMAEPKAYTDLEELSFKNSMSDIWPTPLGFGRDVPLFTAPPVTEVNTSNELTALLRAIESFQAIQANDRWNESGKLDDAYSELSEAAIKAAPLIKRLNGLGE